MYVILSLKLFFLERKFLQQVYLYYREKRERERAFKYIFLLFKYNFKIISFITIIFKNTINFQG